jgi:hypothetical protein
MKFPTGHYDNDQIDVLQAARNQACKELCLSKADPRTRHLDDDSASTGTLSKRLQRPRYAASHARKRCVLARVARRSRRSIRRARGLHGEFRTVKGETRRKTLAHASDVGHAPHCA